MAIGGEGSFSEEEEWRRRNGGAGTSGIERGTGSGGAEAGGGSWDTSRFIEEILDVYLGQVFWKRGLAGREAAKGIVSAATERGIFGRGALQLLLFYKEQNEFRFRDEFQYTALYRLIFLLARDRNHKTLGPDTAALAWCTLLRGRFPFVREWCNFIDELRPNITEDTWRQVLDFSRIAKGGLEGYDPLGAWPVLVDEFVEYMQVRTGADGTPSPRQHQITQVCEEREAMDVAEREVVSNERKRKLNANVDELVAKMDSVLTRQPKVSRIENL